MGEAQQEVEGLREALGASRAAEAEAERRAAASEERAAAAAAQLRGLHAAWEEAKAAVVHKRQALQRAEALAANVAEELRRARQDVQMARHEASAVNREALAVEREAAVEAARGGRGARIRSDVHPPCIKAKTSRTLR